MKKHQMKRRLSSHVATRQRFTKLAFEPLEHRRLLTIFTVINVSDSGTGSLRDAIHQANANPGDDTITFAIPGSGVHKITPLTGLPQITDPVTIDGDLQPGYTGTPLIELDGSLAANASGLEFVVGGNVVNGLDIHSFQFDGILIAEQQTTGGGNNYINGNYIGTDPTGKIAEGNVAAGIQLIGSPFDHIDDNLISGNDQDGIFVADSFSAYAQITNNLIGTDVTGLAPLGNKINGVALGAPPNPAPGSGYASYITVGGLTAADRNVIAGNGQAGVWIRGGAGNVVKGNYIGVGIDGTTPLGNGVIADPSYTQFGTDGVYIDGGSSNVIGGSEDGAGNIISANANDGVRINATDISATGNFVQGNYIGTDKSGEISLFLGNHHDGIEINNNSTDTSIQVSHTTIGGADIDDGTVDGVVKARNIISGNTSFGIAIVGHRIDSTAILGNFIGTDSTGLLNDGNGQSGILISSFGGEDPTSLGPSNTTIGNAEGGSPNLISGNSVYGISIAGGTSTTIERNLIGVDITESTAMPNSFSGIDVLGPAGVTIGGLPQTVDGASIRLGNVIAGNANDGVLIQSGATGVQIVANYIGMSPVNNKLGNKNYGIDIRDSASNLIGGGGTAAANYIVNNGIDGVVITGQTATNNFIDGNDIGMLADGTADGNTIDGILIYNAPGNTIGGLIADTVNVISSNGGAGVHVDGAFSTGNRIIGNYIGTDPTGTITRGNSGGGVLISDAASGNFVGVTGGGVQNVISGNLVAGIAITNASTNNTIVNNLIGVDRSADNPVPNVGMGILIVDSAYNTIGGAGTGGNVIEFTATDPDQDPTVGSGHGISISGQAAIGNQVLNNGISANATDGIRIGEGATQNTIGDTTLATHNVISSNLRAVSIESNSSGNEVVGNYIGTDENGDADEVVGNTLGGVALTDVTNNIIQDNTIRDNPIGVGIANADSTGNRVIGNTITNSSSEGVQVTRGASNNVIGGTNTTSRNIISANARGITIDTEAHSNSVIGNFIGTDASGDYDENMGNTIGGIAISHSPDNTIQGNTIRGNPIGVGMAFADTTGNYLLGNTITESSSEGVQIVQGASNNVIGGSSAVNRNIISINQLGISITAGSNNNSVVGNYIGTDDDGNFSDGYGNSQDGVEILDSNKNSIDSNKIVGSVNGVDIENSDTQGNTVAGNTITNNTQYAVALLNGTSGNIIGGVIPADTNLLSMDPRGVSIESGSHDNQVIGNNIGTDPSGNFEAGYGDTSIGVGITDSYANLIQDNTIRGNQFGVGIRNAPSVGNQVQGNIITNSTGYGVLLANGASNNLIGGKDDGDGNQISQNGDAGVWADSGTGNAILHNNLFGNAALGIDLAPAGVTPNDDPSLLDADTGPNNLQNFPVLIAATTGGSHQVSGTLASAANTTYILEFFNVATPDPSGYGQGDQYLTTTTVTTNASGIATFNAILPNSVAVGTYISATATDPGGNTSEFSKVVPVQQDSDGDGVGDDTENSGPGGGDANGDGIPDSQQANVATFQDPVSGQDITLVAPAGTTFSGITPIANPSPSDAPFGVTFYQGLFSFTLSGVAPGASVAVQEILPAGSNPVDYYRYGPLPWDSSTTGWYDWLDNGNGQYYADINGNVITLHFVDGQYGDDDQAANGIIVDPGGPAFQTRFTVTNTNDDGPGSLRQAINDANSHPGDDLIDFNVPGSGVHTIRVQSQLPFLNEAVTIDATTQPGYAGKPLIEVDGEDVSFSIGLGVFASNVTIRGLDINRFSRLGIGLYQGSTYAAYNVDIEACYIGTDPTGTIAEGNGDGIDVFGGSGTIGGALAGQGNLISGNWGDGIHVYRDYGMSIVGNLIGTAADGVTALGNAGDGVHLDLTNSEPYRSQYVTVGGLDPGDANVIAFNGQDGIEDTSSDNYGYGYNIVSYSAGNVFLSNSIYDNSRLGISHRYSKEFLHAAMVSDSGQDVNDGASGSDGYSNPQNYPVLNSALSSSGQTTITGHLDSAPDVTYWVQFFSNQQGTVTGYGQGQTYLGTATVTTDDSGHADFSVTLSVSVSNGQLIAATASIIGGGTSDFSQRIAVGDVLGNVFVVNSTDDTDDGAYNPAHVTLRDAILAADAHPGQDTIEFDIPGGGVQTIMPATALPLITDPVIIDGTSQPGYSGTPLIQISGTNVEQNDVSGAPINEIGMFVETNDSTIRALNVNSFSSGSNIGTGIVMEGSNNVLVGCFIGTDPTGTIAEPNTLGSLIIGENDRIGGTTAADRNLISGNVGGMAIGTFANSTPNVIEGNFIGTDVTGSLAVPNLGGAALSVSGATIIGGTAPGAGNVISGNGGSGLGLSGGNGSIIQGNLIGTDVTGTKKLGNAGDGMDINSQDGTDPGTIIGGTAAGARNIVSSNGGNGIVDVGFSDVIQGNLIGTDITGTLNFGNGYGGGSGAGMIVGGGHNLVGGPQAGAGNVISGNAGPGISIIQAPPVPNTSTNMIQGNLIGTQIDGVSPLGNGADGIYLDNGAAGSYYTGPQGPNVIGGLEPGDANTIAFNGADGVDLQYFFTPFNYLEPVVQNILILSNSIYSNAKLGIDLGNDGVTANDTGDADNGSNDLLNFPALVTVGSNGVISTVTGTYNSTPNTYITLQFFLDAAADLSGHGEGQTLLGTRYLTTDASGNATFSFNFSMPVAPGQFVSATASNPDGATSEFSNDVTWSTNAVAANQAPAVSVGGPYTINEGDSLSLDASHSNDPDGDPLTYTWDINGDGVFGDVTGATPTLTWAQLNALGIVNGPSTFNLSVRVNDGQGHVVTSAATTLTVLNVAPTADAGPDQYVNVEDTVSLTGTFTDPGTADTHTLSWHVDADNGQTIADGSGPSFSFVPDDAGTYTVTFSVTDSDGATGTAVVHVYAYDVSPVASIVGLPTQSTVDVPINLTAEVSDISPVVTAAGFSYYWDAYSADTNDYFYSTDPTDPDFSFTPTGTGTYGVELYVEDKNGGNAYVFQSVTVVSGTNAGTAPTVAQLAAATINEGDTYTATGSFADPDVGDSWTSTVNYGDGTGNQPLTLNPDKTFDLSHVYADNGSFDVVVTVTDSYGLSGTQTSQVTVNNEAPSVTLGTPTSVAVDAVFSLLGSFTDPGNDTWTATVNFGDGTGNQPLALNADHTFDLSHIYQSADHYHVAVTVTDDDGGAGTANVTEVVNNVQTSLTVAAASATYGGTTNLSATLLAGSNPISGKTLSFSINGQPIGAASTDATGTATLTNVPLTALHAGTATISVSFAGDDVDAANTGTTNLTIGKAALTITADAKTKIYGAALPALTASYSGLANGDTPSSLTTAPTITTTGTSTSHVGSYSIAATGAVDNDYTITYKAGTLNVTSAALTITADTKTKIYGAALPALTASYSGLVNGDTPASLTTAPTLTTTATPTSHAGSYSIAATGAVDNDYTITYKAGTLSVTPAALTITADSKTKLYGAALPALTASYSGLVNGDTPASLTTAPTITTTATSASHVGSYSITATGAVDNDYTIGYQPGTLSVTPAALTITADSKTKLYGAALPALTASYSGLVNGDTPASLTTAPTITTTATSASHVGSYSITAIGAVDNDYAIIYKAGTLSVTPAALTITADNKTKVAGTANPALTFTPSAFVNGDTAASLTTQPTLTTTATTSSQAGTYPITASGAVDSDYTISYAAGTLTVTAATTGGSISGKDYLDVTGNGLTSDDTPLAGVKVYLDTNNNGVWNAGEPTATTLTDGSYTFTSLAAGKYTVREIVPSGYIRTAPATTDNYSVTLATGQTSSGDNFANAQLGNTSILCNVAYLINGTTAVADLRGATHEGDTIEVSFTIAAGTAPQRITLVSYNAPSAIYDANTAAQQTIFDSDTGVFGPGSYTLTVSNPHTYFQLDFVEGAAIDHLGANGSNIFYTNQNRLFSADNGGTDARRASPASLTGYAYLDSNNNGIFETSERPVAGVKVTVTAGSVTQSVVTDMHGAYTFDNLPAGTYTITETQPTGYSDGKDTLGNKGGTASNDKFTGITLTAGSAGAGYNFGELQTVGSAVAGNQTQSAAWWDGSSGQALIKAVNGGQTSKTLGNWLATNFNNLFGADAGSANNLSGKTNAQIATFYQSLYGNTSKRPEADTLALALNMYVTNSSLAGNTAASYGFSVSTSGVAVATVNVAANGAAFGISDNTVMTIGELLVRANARSRKGMLWDSDGNGSLNSSESVLRSQADALFTIINNS